MTAAAGRRRAPFLHRHPARWIALGFGSGLAPFAPGTAGTLWAWAAFTLLSDAVGPAGWGWVIAVGLVVGAWACTRTAQAMGQADPGRIVWDEIVAFWVVLWVVTPASGWWQLAAFAAFRYFDAVKPGPVRWADSLFKAGRGMPIGWRQGVGILLDDLVAAACTLLWLALCHRVLA